MVKKERKGVHQMKNTYTNVENRCVQTTRFVLTAAKSIMVMKGLIRISKFETQRMLETTIVLLRNTTWKCGKVERLVVNYLRKQLKRRGCTKVKDIVEHFKSKEIRQYQFFESIERLEKRSIIKLVFDPFQTKSIS